MSLHESKVLELVTSYRTVNERHPLVDILCSNADSNSFFHETLNHDAFIISKRSQDIEDGEISIYQKAFLILSDNQPQDYNAAVAIWTDELFGFRAMPSEMEALDILAKLTAKVYAMHRRIPFLPIVAHYCARSKLYCRISNVQLTNYCPPDMKQLLEAHVLEDEEHAVEATTEDHMMILSQDTDSHKEVHESPSSMGHDKLPDKTAENDTPKPFANDSNFQRLLETYHKARRDFDEAIPRSKNRTAAARFLRDTSENCLSYLRRKGCESIIEALTQSSMEQIKSDKAVIHELEDTVAETIAFVEGCSGGKKRSFDEENPTDPSTASTRTQSKSASPKKKRRPRIKPITSNSKTARAPIRTHHMPRQQAPSPENLRLGRHEVTVPWDRPKDDRSQQSPIQDRRREPHDAVQRRESGTGDHSDDARGRHTYRFDTASHTNFASRPFERDISEGGYPSNGFRQEFGMEDRFQRGSEYHEMAHEHSAPRAWDSYRPIYDY